MRLESLSVKDNTFELGLKPVNMARLGQVVALFGPNGAGKSRLLRLVTNVMREDVESSRKGGLEVLLDGVCSRAFAIEQQIKSLQEKVSRPTLDDTQRKNLLAQVLATQGQLDNLRKQQDSLQAQRERKTEYAFPPEPGSPIVEIVRPALRLREVGDYEISHMTNSMKTIWQPLRPKEMEEAITPFFDAMARAEFNAHHPEADPETFASWATILEAARRLLRKMLRMEFGYSVDGPDVRPTLNNRPLRIGELSLGQRQILYYTVCLLGKLLAEYKEGGAPTLDGGVVILDEPELHLHPCALIELIKSMREVVGETGQIWIATHAVSLLPYLKRGETWLVNDGRVSAPGSDEASEALRLLIGSDDAVDRMREYLLEADRIAATRFAAECLIPPRRVGFRDKDPQLFQISSVLKTRIGANKTVRILDYGAGTGRLAVMLHTTIDPKQEQYVEYIPIEPDESCHPDIIDASGSLLKCSQVYLDQGALPPKYDGTVDVAVLCNVLHEIRPTKWKDELNGLLRLVAPTGSLVICEDQAMPIGEYPHELGFLVLNEVEIGVLFGVSQDVKTMRHPDEKYEDRLLCVEIPRASAVVTSETVKEAVESLRRRVEAEVRHLRKESKGLNNKHGRLYALRSQMFVNSHFAIKELQ